MKGALAHWRMAHGAWRMAHGAWRMAHGAWRMAHGAWRMAHGAWRTAHGARRMAHGAFRRDFRRSDDEHGFDPQKLYFGSNRYDGFKKSMSRSV
jgi:hypothetical protein